MDSENATTPTQPHSRPPDCVLERLDSASAGPTIALSLTDMKDDNSTQAVTQLLRELARQGAPDARLPSVRELQRQHRVSPLTVKHAMAPLIAEGLIEALPGHGT